MAEAAHAEASAVGSADKFWVYFWSYQPWRFIVQAAENPTIYRLNIQGALENSTVHLEKVRFNITITLPCIYQ
jgi:hypothetical protein